MENAIRSPVQSPVKRNKKKIDENIQFEACDYIKRTIDLLEAIIFKWNEFGLKT